MIAENNRKNKKFKFDETDFDFSWEINEGNSIKTSIQNYADLLRITFDYDPALHEFDSDRFRVSNK